MRNATRKTREELGSKETSQKLLDAIEELADQLGENPEKIWENGYTEKLSPKETDTALIKILNKYVYEPKYSGDDELFWGAGSVFAKLIDNNWVTV